jgi:uncharacterized RmlC-like cupin family protein
VRLTGEFIRHSYADADGFFSGTDGVLRMRFRERYEDEGAGAFIVLPTSVQHEPEALTPETCVLLVEKAGTVNTGDGPANPRTVAGSEFI